MDSPDRYIDIPPPEGADSRYIDIPPPTAPGPSIGSDVLQSLPQYAETAISHTVGLPGDIANLATAGLQHFGYAQNQPHYTGSGDVQSGLNQFQGGPLYQPQTPVGKAGDVAASFLPALIGGPEALATKFATRVAAPAALTQGIEESSLPEGAKPWAEGAAILLAPFSANKVISSTLNAIKRSAPLGVANEIGVLPTTAQLGKAKTELERIHAMARDPQTQQLAKAAWDEISKRHEGMKIIDSYTGGGRARYLNATKYRRGLIELQKDMEAGKVPDVFSPEQKAQIAKVAEGGALMRGAQAVSKIGPLHSMSHASSYGILGFLASKVTEGTPLHAALIAGVPQAVAMVAKAAYPHFTKNQINKLVELVQKGRKVPGAPQSFAPRPEPSFSPVPPIAQAAQRISNLQGD